MPASRRLAVALAAGLLVVLLSLGGSARGATSFGAPGAVVFVQSGTLFIASTGSLGITGTQPSWSPDGTKLAYVDTASGHIATCTYASGACTSPTVTTVAGTEPVWSPDGTKLAYVDGSGALHTLTYPGLSDTTFMSTGTSADPSWDPADGTKLAFSNGGSIYTCVVSACTLGSSIVSGTHPAWSPDGTTIAYETGGNISTIPAGGGSSTAVTTTGTGGGHTPNWSPDGTSLVYSDNAGKIEVTTLSGGSWGTPSARDGGPGDATPDWQTVAPQKVTAPQIFGTAQSGQLLSTDNGTWHGADPTHFAYTYAWKRCDSTGNNCNTTIGTSSTYAVSSSDVGSTIRLVVTASNVAGSTSSDQSNATAVVTAAGVVSPPSNIVYPVITLPTGETVPELGDTLFASAGSWTGSFPMTFTYQWKMCAADDPFNGACYSIAGATASFFTVPASLYGLRIRVAVTATNSAAAISQNSTATEIVTAVPPHLSITPPIVGQTVVDQTLSVDTGTWLGSTPMTFAFVWERCDAPGDVSSCVPIPNATSRTYVPTTADIGSTLRVAITGTNPAGTASGLTNHTYPIVDKQHFGPSVVTQPSVNGTVGLGLKLTASIGSFSGDTPIATTFVWQRCDATGSDCHTIRGAKKTAYTPTRNDFGSTLRVAVTAKNAYGKLVAASTETPPVTVPWPHIRGKRIVGGPGSVYILGTTRDDVIYGGPGNDTIQGNGGYDTIHGGRGHNVISVSGPGNSRIYTGRGSDTIYAADGYQDDIECGTGHNRVYVDAFDITKNCTDVIVVGSTSTGTGSTSTSP